MLKNASSASISNNQSISTFGSMLRRNKIMKCFCQDESVLRIVTDVNNINYGRKLLGCRIYMNRMDKGCNLFKWLGDEFVNEMDLKFERQKKKN